MKEERYKQHPSHVKVSLSRISCGGKGLPLFGSTIYHSNIISLKIHKAEATRSLNEDRIYAHETIAEVFFSPFQFADLITTLNHGSGTPGTLHYFNGETYELPTIQNKTEQFKKEIRGDVEETVKKMNQAMKRVNEILNKKSILKDDKEELRDIIETAKGLFEHHLPFILDQFGEQMDKTVSEAKASVDAFVTQVVQETGLEVLKENSPKLLEGENATK